MAIIAATKVDEVGSSFSQRSSLDLHVSRRWPLDTGLASGDADFKSVADPARISHPHEKTGSDFIAI